MDFHNAIELILGVVGVGGMGFIARILYSSGALVAKIETSLGSLAQSLGEIRTNHLPHLEEKVDKLQDAFIIHLQKSGEGK